MSASAVAPERVPDVECSSESLLHSSATPDRYEQHRCIREPKLKRAWRSLRDEWPRPARVLLAINAALNILLLGLYLHTLWRIHSSQFYQAPKPPYSPLLEDGVIEYVNKRFHPNRIFQEDPSPSVDKAWESILGRETPFPPFRTFPLPPLLLPTHPELALSRSSPHEPSPPPASDGIVRLPLLTSQRIGYPSSEIYYAPGSYIYGVSMFHQLHCLDILRRSFWREHYFPNTSDEEFHDHRAHCLDFLRQAIMCNGDVQMTYWWNKNYTYVDEDTKEERYTEEYLRMDKKERAYGTALLWDVEHQCRNFERIQEWTREHQLRDEKYWREAPNFRKTEE